MDYRVVITIDAEYDLDRVIQYLIYEKENEQAAANVLNDFEETIQRLRSIAGSLKQCENPRLKELGYRKMHFQHHRYFLMYRIIGDVVYVDDVFHDLQDYESILI